MPHLSKNLKLKKSFPPISFALGGDWVRAQRADPPAAQQGRGRQPASTRPEP
jgi:hypothetical protein